MAFTPPLDDHLPFSSFKGYAPPEAIAEESWRSKAVERGSSPLVALYFVGLTGAQVVKIGEKVDKDWCEEFAVLDLYSADERSVLMGEL